MARAKRHNQDSVTVEVTPAPNASVMTPERADHVAAAYLKGAPTPPGISQGAMDLALTRIKRLEAPADCPTDHEEWRQEVSRLLGIAIYKMAKRLAETGDSLPLGQTPVAMAVLVDKRAVLTGQPTSFNFNVTASLSHESLLAKIRGVQPGNTNPSTSNVEAVTE